MSKKSENTQVIRFKKAYLTTCLLTIFLPSSIQAADAVAPTANENIQTILKRIKEKNDAYNAQQAALAAQSQEVDAPADSTPISQNLDVTPANTTTANDLYISAPEDNQSRFAAGEELILSTSVNGHELASLFGIKTEKGLQIGIGDFFQIVEFAIYTDLDQVTAEGWYRREANHFSLKRLDDGRLEVKTDKNTYYVNPKDYVIENDIFIEMDDLKRWFDLNYTLNEERLSLEISAKEKFPVEVRLARQDRKTSNVTLNNRSTMPLKESPYQAFSSPMLDVQTWVQETEQVIPPPSTAPDDEEPQHFRETSANYSVLASHDLAYLNTELFLAGNKDDHLNSARLTLSRQSDKGDLLGALHATEYAFGDVVPVNAGLGSTQAISRGVSVSNTPINQLADNRKVNITGEIQVGWDVELYRNGVLIDQRLGTAEGRYEFNDIPLEYGNNDFELMMYGPQGQIETKSESYIVDSNNVLGGQAMYRVSLVEIGESVFNVDPFFDDPTQQGMMASTVFDYGITDWLAVSAGSSTFEPKEGDTQQFVNLGASASFGKAGLLNARFSQDSDRFTGSDINYRTRVFNTSYSFDYLHSENTDPTSLALNGVDKITTDEYNATMSGRLFNGSWLPISYQNAWRRQEQQELDTREEFFANSIGIGSRLGYFSNNVILQKDVPIDPTLIVDPAITTEDIITGSFQYRKNFGRLHTRLFNTYGIEPTSDVFTYGGAFNYSWSSNFNTELKYAYYTLSDKSQINLGLNWRKDSFYLTTNAAYNDDGSWSAGLALRFSLGYEPIQHSVFTSAQPIAQSGAVAVRVFEDLNMNGTFDENERPIENATVKAVQAYRQDKTNESGVAVLSSLYNNTTTDIVVDESTLDGPFMITAIPGVAVKARKGYVDKIDLPVVKAGEVEGIIYLKEKNGESNPAAYIMINLVDKHGKIVASTSSEYDGYYLFTNVLPGSYDLKVDENYIDRRGLKVSDKKLDFSSNGDVIAGVDFVLRPLDEAKGYVAIVGHFETPTMLKLYYHILRKKLGGQFVQMPFYIKHPNKGGYTLGIAYYEGPPVPDSVAEQNAKQACDNLASSEIYCEVQYQDFKY